MKGLVGETVRTLERFAAWLLLARLLGIGQSCRLRSIWSCSPRMRRIVSSTKPRTIRPTAKTAALHNGTWWAGAMMRSWGRWVAVLGGGVIAGLCAALLQLKVRQENLQPTPLLQLVSLLLLGLGFAVPWWLVSRWRHRRRSRGTSHAGGGWQWPRSAVRRRA
jgi:hypothetical protein